MAARAGDFFTARAGRIPIVVTHAEDGETRAFVNVCRHRGSTVAEGAGNRKTLQCPYHAWTYGLDGRLRAAPRADFELDDVGLEPVRLERWGPFLFVNADADAEPLADWLGPVPAQVAELGLDVDALQFHHRAEWSVAANWKVVAENFLECYHCAVAHPGFSALVDVSPDAYRLEVGRLHSTQIGPARDGETRSQFHFVWPNTGINVFPGEANLSIGPFVPGAPDRTDRFLDYFFGAGVAESWISELLELDDAGRARGHGARRARPGRRELGRDRRRPPARRGGAARRALPGPRARRARASGGGRARRAGAPAPAPRRARARRPRRRPR